MSPKSKRKGLGWVRHTDARDLRIRAVVAPTAATPRQVRYWYDSQLYLDQGDTDACTGYGPDHLLADGPVTHPIRPLYDPQELYRANVAQDRADGRVFDGGATMLAAAKVLRARGAIGEYRFGRTVDEVLASLLEVGPVLLGTDWHAGMDEPDAQGVVRVTGAVRGGHCYEANGVSRTSGLIRCKNSWGRGWGKRGRFYLPIDDFARLLADDGDAVLFREMPTPDAAPTA